MPQRTPLDALSDDEFAALYEHHTRAEIIAEYGVSKQVLSWQEKQRGIKPSQEQYYRNQYREQIPLIRQMADSGASIKDVRDRLGMSYPTLRNICQAAGIEFYTWQRPGCPDCERNPYARGLCRNCYMCAYRQRMLDD